MPKDTLIGVSAENLEPLPVEVPYDPQPAIATTEEADREREREDKLRSRAAKMAKSPLAGSGGEVAAVEVPPEDRAVFERLYYEELKKSRPSEKLTTGGRFSASVASGMRDVGGNILGWTGLDPQPIETDDQRLFLDRLNAIKQGLDPLVDKNAPWYERGALQAGRQAPTMIASQAVGGLLGTAAKAAGLGRLGVGAAQAAGVGATYYDQMYDDTYVSLLKEGIDPETAKTTASASAILQGAAESLLSANPFARRMGSTAVSKTIRDVVLSNLKRFGGEVGEEGFQAVIDETAKEVARRVTGGKDKGALDILSKGLAASWESVPSMVFLMGPGMAVGGTAEAMPLVEGQKRMEARAEATGETLEQRTERLDNLNALRNIREKGFVSKADGKKLGLSPEEMKSRATRREAVDERLDELEKAKEIQDAEKVQKREAPREEVGQVAGEQGAGEQGQVQPEPGQEVASAPEVQQQNAVVTPPVGAEDVVPQPRPEPPKPEPSLGPPKTKKRGLKEPPAEPVSQRSKMDRDADRVVELNSRIEKSEDSAERDSAIAIRNKISGKYDTEEFSSVVDSLTNARKNKEKQERKNRKAQNKTPEYRARVARGRIGKDVDKMRRKGVTEAGPRKGRKPLGRAVWTNEDGVERPVVVSHVSGLKGDEVFVGIEGSNTSIPLSQIRFEGEQAEATKSVPAEQEPKPTPKPQEITGKKRTVSAEQPSVQTGVEYAEESLGDADLGAGKGIVARVGGETVGYVKSSPGGQNERNAAERLFPDVYEGGNVRRSNAITVDKPQQGQGIGKELYLRDMAENPKDWFFNSGTSPEATGLLNKLEKEGLIELHWEKPTDEKGGGPRLMRITDKGLEEIGKLKGGGEFRTSLSSRTVSAEQTGVQEGTKAASVKKKGKRDVPVAPQDAVQAKQGKTPASQPEASQEATQAAKEAVPAKTKLQQAADTAGEDAKGEAKEGKANRPSGKAMAALTEGDSYRPVQPEQPGSGSKPGRPKSIPPSQARQVVSDVVGMASPAHVSDVSREAGHIMREEMARAAQWDEVSRESLRVFDRKFLLMSPEESYEFTDLYEAGEKQKTSELEAISKSIRKELDKGRDRLQSLGKLQDFYENYFPHLWKDVQNAIDTIRSISSGKPWRSSGFLKQRTHITHKEGRDAGLEPISDNPIEMALLRLHQINKYVARTNTMERLKQSGLMRFVPESIDNNYMPSGYEYYDDPAFRVVTDPSITIEEAYDKLLVDQLSAVLQSLGISHERVAKMSRGKWGKSEGKGITTRFAGPVSVMAHELGHQIGDSWGLFDYLTKGAPVEGTQFKSGKKSGQENKADAQRKRSRMQRELRALADLRVEGQSSEVVEGTKQYRRKKAEKEAVILESWLAAPDKMAEVAPTVTAAWKEFLQRTTPLSPLLNLDRSVVLGTREQTVNQPGTLTLGKWAMPRDVARMVKNMLSPGLRSNPNQAVKGTYRLARILGNAMNQASLSLSGFHALNVLTDASASSIGIGIQQLERGKIGKALWNLVKAPAAGVIGTVRGGKLIKAMRSDLSSLSPEMKAFVEDAIQSGARASMDPVYHNHAVRGIAKSIRTLRYGEGMKKADAAVRLPAQMIIGALEMTAKPIMEIMVPRMKLAVFYSMAEDIHARAAQEGLSDFQIREQMSQSWDSVDNRLGQLAYDNLFWNMYLKDVSMLAVRSVGWNLGSFREYGGAVMDVAATTQRIKRGDQFISRKMGYAIGAVATYAPIGALLMYAFTGDWPEELKDYFFPKTGRENPDGSPERLSLPTYAKDWVAWTTQPGTVAKHKLHPMWGTIADMVTNENYYGVEIRQEDDPWYTQLKDTMNHAGESFVPFSVKNLQRFTDSGEDPALAYLMAFSGITSAPAYISRSPAQKLAYSMMIGNIPQGSRTSEQAEASRDRKDIVLRLRTGGKVTEEEIRLYSKRQMKLIVSESKKTSFQTVVGRLHSDQTMKVWALASDKEKEQIRQPLRLKFIKQVTDPVGSINTLNKSKQSRVYLNRLGVTSYDEALQLLVDFYDSEKGGAYIENVFPDTLKKGFKDRRSRLAEMYRTNP